MPLLPTASNVMKIDAKMRVFFRLHIGDRAHLYNKHLSQRAFHTRELRRKVIMKHTSTTSKHNKQDSFHR